MRINVFRVVDHYPSQSQRWIDRLVGEACLERIVRIFGGHGEKSLSVGTVITLWHETVSTMQPF